MQLAREAWAWTEKSLKDHVSEAGPFLMQQILALILKASQSVTENQREAVWKTVRHQRNQLPIPGTQMCTLVETARVS